MKRIVLWVLLLFVVTIVVVFSIEESRVFTLDVMSRTFVFLKENILTLLAAFFLVKGKFILLVFLKKVAVLSATGLGKRYLIEKVINHNIKIHFLDYIGNDIKRLVAYIKENFKDFPIIKQVITGIAFFSSLGFVGKFMGSMLAMKVFIAKFWSFLLALVLKSGTAVVYFFTDYLWGSWIAPLIEVLIFSWLFDLMDKVPFLKKYLSKLYAFFSTLFKWFEDLLEKIFHIPLKRFFKFLARRIKKRIYAFIGYERVPVWKRLQEIRELKPNKHMVLKQVRKEQKDRKKHKKYVSPRERILGNRKSRT